MAKTKAQKKQADLPGVEGPGVAPVRIKELEDLSGVYVKIRDRRCTITPKEVEAKRNLIDAMKRHKDRLEGPDGILRYVYDDVLILVTHGEDKLKVRSAVEMDGAGSEED